mgnify:CR=1 FL=1
MTREEIMVLDAEQIDARSAELASEIEVAETNEAMDAIQAEMEAIEERKAVIKLEVEQRKADMAAVIQGHGDVVEEVKDERKVNTMEMRNTPEYINAYAEYIKSGNDMECRKLTSENDTTPNGTGTVAVPEFVYDIVKTAWEREGIMSLVRKSYLKGNLKVQFEISGEAAVIHAEGDTAVSEENLVLGIVTLVPQSIKKWISISDEVYDLAGEEFLDYIYDELTYRIAKKLADAIIADIEACGTASTGALPAVPKITSTTVTLGLVAQALAELSDEATDPVIMMNKSTWGAFKAAQADGNYGYDPFEGLPVLFNDTISAFSAATTGVTFAIVGDLGIGAQANFPNGQEIEIKFDDKTKMEYDLIRILGREYVGHAVVAPKAFCKICH